MMLSVVLLGTVIEQGLAYSPALPFVSGRRPIDRRFVHPCIELQSDRSNGESGNANRSIFGRLAGFGVQLG